LRVSGFGYEVWGIGSGGLLFFPHRKLFSEKFL
jgi:hypothetical protein